MTGHLTSCSCIVVERQAARNIVVSGGYDTNVKLWDMRVKSAINTFKAHNKEITCLDISPDSKIAVSGSKDGTVKLWDPGKNSLIHSTKISAAAHPICCQFNPCDLTLAVGTSSKCVKYWELEDYKLVSSTTIENSEPRSIRFNKTGEAAFVAYDDCTRVYNLDVEVKP